VTQTSSTFRMAIGFQKERLTPTATRLQAFGHVHTPQYAGPAQAGKSKRGIFGDSVAEVDSSVGAIMAALGDSDTICLLSSGAASVSELHSSELRTYAQTTVRRTPTSISSPASRSTPSPARITCSSGPRPRPGKVASAVR
jgi:hypothetical protein